MTHIKQKFPIIKTLKQNFVGPLVFGPRAKPGPNRFPFSYFMFLFLRYFPIFFFLMERYFPIFVSVSIYTRTRNNYAPSTLLHGAMETTNLGNQPEKIKPVTSCSCGNVYKNRRDTLKRKASELATLCNVDVCVICYGSDGTLELWPEDAAKARSIILKYINEATTQTSRSKRKKDLNLSDLEFPSKYKKIMKLGYGDDRDSYKGLGPWDEEELGKLSKPSLIGLSDYLESKIQFLGDKIQYLTKGKDQIHDDDQLIYKELGDHGEKQQQQQHSQFISTDHNDQYYDPSWSDILNMLAETDDCDMVEKLWSRPSGFSHGAPTEYYSDNSTTLLVSSSHSNNTFSDVTWPCESYHPEIGESTSCSSTTSTSTCTSSSGSGCSDDYWSELLGDDNNVDFGVEGLLTDQRTRGGIWFENSIATVDDLGMLQLNNAKESLLLNDPDDYESAGLG